MDSKPTPLILAMLSVLVVAGLGSWSWTLDPEHPARWARLVLTLPVFWGFLELAQFRGDDRATAGEIMNWHRSVIAWTGLVIAVGMGFRLAVASGLLEADWGPSGRRITWIILAIGMVLWGNYLPKIPSPWRGRDEPFDWQRVHRFVGWIASLGGIVLVAVWFVLPPEEARSVTRAILGSVAVLAVGRKFMSVAARSLATPTVR